LLASACLLALKAADFMLSEGYFVASNNAPSDQADTAVVRTTPDVVQHTGSGLSWAQQMFNFPDGSGAAQAPELAAAPAAPDDGDITGSVTTPAPDGKAEKSAKADAAPAAAAPAAPAAAAAAPPAPLGKGGSAKSPPGTVIPLNGPDQMSGAERAILERLQERRQELDARARELDIRESLSKEAEKRIDAKLAEIKEEESKLAVATQQKDDAATTRLKGLVTMYENMKPRDAAKIFDHLEVGVLLEVASKINPREMAEILAQMSPDMAERLTVELASNAQQVRADGSGELPKIQGQPTTP
jgi:flagellar motility protein MotE (MotC chaperone)